MCLVSPLCGYVICILLQFPKCLLFISLSLFQSFFCSFILMLLLVKHFLLSHDTSSLFPDERRTTKQILSSFSFRFVNMRKKKVQIYRLTQIRIRFIPKIPWNYLKVQREKNLKSHKHNTSWRSSAWKTNNKFNRQTSRQDP